MKNIQNFKFIVDRDNKKIKVEKEFDAPRPLVWKAWTDPEILDQWFAPEPWRAETHSFDFSEGGEWFYAMVSPEGEKHWSLEKFEKITAQETFSCFSSFCDENKIIDKNLPQGMWKNVFIDNNDTTLVNVILSFERIEDLEAIISMGFKEGFTMGLGNLDKLLPSLK